ncbi:hypothetical protein ACFQBQ_13150 [Granulicella cerasi]|uniref:Agarase n=1 Tax=Granulicella cerasi TaxID=741063 RepID=A0ABW1ZAT4_9BACT|nr:hypothetical protein [Granulicella cerasi]
MPLVHTRVASVNTMIGAAPSTTPITTAEPSTLFDSFEATATDPSYATLTATATSSTQYATQGTHSLQVVMAANQPYPTLKWTFSTPKDWSMYPGLVVDIYNPQTVPVTFYGRIDDSSSYTQTDTVTLLPQALTSVLLPFSEPLPAKLNLKTGARLPGYAVMALGGAPVNTTSVSGFRFFVNTTNGSAITLYFDNLRLVDGYASMSGAASAVALLYQGIVDKYGQFTKETWTGKVLQDSDLNAPETLPMPPSDRDIYGGANNYTGSTATGYFHTTKLSNGNWWFVDPLGKLFFSIGMDTMGSQAWGGSTQTARVPTYIGPESGTAGGVAGLDRTAWFTSLPTSTDPLAIFYGRQSGEGYFCDVTSQQDCAFDFFSANLQRKYGSSFISQWNLSSVNRLYAWGFNTMGDFSDPVMERTIGSSGQKIPYTIKVLINHAADYNNITVPVTGFGRGGAMPDPWDSNFEAAVEAEMNLTLNTDTNDSPSLITNDPYMLGYFVDNEMPWTNAPYASTAASDGSDDLNYFPLVYGVIETANANQPAKVAFANIMGGQYTTIANMNAAWGTSYTSFTDFRNHTNVPPMTPAMRADFSNFLRRYAEKYYILVAQAVHAVDTNHLYLGSKYSVFTPEVVKACSEFADVISFDTYASTLTAANYPTTLSTMNKPSIVAEYHFGAPDRGGFNGGLAPVATQTQRGVAYDQYLRSVYANPLFIGAQWYQYQDEMITGRQSDGENYPIGFVTITDKVYSELSNAARTTNGYVYDTTNGGRAH